MRQFSLAFPTVLIALFDASGPLVLASPSAGQGPAQALAQVEFVFKGFAIQAGRVMSQLTCADRPGEKGQTVPAQVDVRGPQVVIRFRDQRAGQVCTMRAFRDENANQQLDLGGFGIPKEPYAFSNNAQARFGPPKPEATRFVLQAGQNSQTIIMK